MTMFTERRFPGPRPTDLGAAVVELEAVIDQREALRTAASDLVDLVQGLVLPSPGDVLLARLRAVVDATPTEIVRTPFGEPDPDGWVVRPA
jgi:hypothetical protein